MRGYLGAILILVLTTTPATAAHSWEWLNPTPQGNTLFSSVSGDQYVAVGALGTALTSSDGHVWSAHDTDETRDFRSVAWNGTVYVAVGGYRGEDGFAVGSLSTSTDGSTWTRREVGDVGSLFDVVWSGTQFVAVGGILGDATILTSPDGVAWTRRVSPTPDGLFAVASNGSRLVAAGFAGRVITSTDGISWSLVHENGGNSLFGITWGAGQFVATGFNPQEGALATSPDGLNWSDHETPFLLRGGVAWGAGVFVAVALAPEGGSFVNTVATSIDGISWEQADVPVNIAIDLHDVFWSGTQFLAVGDGGSIFSSPLGLSWTREVSGRVRQAVGIASGNGTFVTVVDSGRILTSTDGTTWSDPRQITGASLHGITFGDGQFVAVGCSGRITRSTDALNWTLSSSGITSCLWDVAWNGTRFVAVGPSGVILTSPDAVKWSPAVSPTSAFLNRVEWTGTEFIVLGELGTLLTSPLGLVWTQRVSGATDWLYGVARNDELYVAVGFEATLTSTDAVTWSVEDVPSDRRGGNDVVWSGDEFLVVRNDGTVIASGDGQVWSHEPRLASHALFDVLLDGGSYYAVGTYGTILRGCTGEDGDGDGVPESCDICVGDDAAGDVDGDGVCDDIDSCVESETEPCLSDGRFHVGVAWRTPADETGVGTAQFRSDDSAVFSFFSPNNLELTLKVLDACAVNGRFWVLAAATTDVEYTVSVTDTETGVEAEYVNPQGQAADAIIDGETFAGAACGEGVEPVQVAELPHAPKLTTRISKQGGCLPESDICLGENDRFRVEVEFLAFNGHEGFAQPVLGVGTDDSSVLWFFESSNWEMLVKVLDGCAINNRYWVFAAATTNVEYTLLVTDTQTGFAQEYFNPLGTTSSAVTDTGAFVCGERWDDSNASQTLGERDALSIWQEPFVPPHYPEPTSQTPLGHS